MLQLTLAHTEYRDGHVRPMVRAASDLAFTIARGACRANVERPARHQSGQHFDGSPAYVDASTTTRQKRALSKVGRRPFNVRFGKMDFAVLHRKRLKQFASPFGPPECDGSVSLLAPGWFCADDAVVDGLHLAAFRR